VKQREIVLGAGNRSADFGLPVEPLAHGLLPESGLAVVAERMTRSKTVGRQRFTVIEPYTHFQLSGE
jgi:hypothetical protein